MAQHIIGTRTVVHDDASTFDLRTAEACAAVRAEGHIVCDIRVIVRARNLTHLVGVLVIAEDTDSTDPPNGE